MKQIITLLFSIIFFYSHTQDIKSEVNHLQELVDAKSYMEAMGFADKLIANKVKEGLQEYASKVYFLRGFVKYELELDQDAIVDMKVSQSLDSRNHEAYFYIADIYYRTAKYSSALENVVYLLENVPSNIDALVLKSKCELEMGNPTAAKMSIQKALALKSSNAELYYIRAVINTQLGEDNLACKDFKIAAKFGYKPAESRIEDYCNEK